jgi:urease gamma subunit
MSLKLFRFLESMGLEELMEHLMESARDGSVVQDIMEFSVSDERPRHNMNRAHSDVSQK